MTPRAFVEQRRIERARRLMGESEYSLAQIAVESGFGTQSRLTVALSVRRTLRRPNTVARVVAEQDSPRLVSRAGRKPRHVGRPLST